MMTIGAKAGIANSFQMLCDLVVCLLRQVPNELRRIPLPVLQFLEADALDMQRFDQLLKAHGLLDKFAEFKRQFPDSVP